MMGVQAASAGVPQQPMALAAALDRANPSISLREAQRLYPSIPLDGTAPATPVAGDKGQGKGKRIVLFDGILESQRLSVVEATSLRSRLLFADPQVFGRMAKQSLKIVLWA